MIIDIPGYKKLQITTLLLDYNGTIAEDGVIRSAVRERLQKLSKELSIYVLTADTHRTARAQCEGLDLKVHTFPVGSAMDAKRAVLDEIGGEVCACMGNGRNDVRMFENAALSIGIIDREGAYSGLLKTVDLCVNSTEDGLDLLLYPKRLIAGLRG